MERKINFNSYDGTELVGIYSYPDNNKVKSAFLLMHGIPSDKNEWGFYSDMANFLSQNGYSSFRFDFRYNGESQQNSISKLTLSEMVNDIESAYKILLENINNKTSVFLVGTSCGGGVTVRWCNIFGRKIKKIFLMAPVFDYEYEITGIRREYEHSCQSSFLTLDHLNFLQLNGYLNNEIQYGREMINEAHIFNARGEIKTLKINVIIFQGTADTVVPISITKKIIENQNNCTLIEIPDADHGFAVSGDDDLTKPGTKQNHFFVYNEMLKRLR